MYAFGYLRASTKDQQAERAKNTIYKFLQEKGVRCAGWYIETASGASLDRPVLHELLEHAEKGDCIVCEQIDRLSRLSESDWIKLKSIIAEKELKVIALDLPSSHSFLKANSSDEFTSAMLKAVNSMLMDMLAAIAHKDLNDRKRRQLEGIERAKSDPEKYKGRPADKLKHEQIVRLKLENGLSIATTAKLAGVSKSTVARVIREHRKQEGLL
ncbi:recombinase family protein [Vibrio crassostreae]|uniref:recombinase family protein n=1 Tax=Vibrio crassostreae TaxID=246167 RepID=UPI001B304904|nr:recombinase family protein [Vibrio crassostreae]